MFPDLPESDIKPALMGESGIDVKLSAEARKKIPVAFECKNVEKFNVWAAIKQAEHNALQEGLKPAVCFGRNRMPEPYVAIPLHYFIAMFYDHYLMQKYKGVREQAEDKS